MSQFKLTEGGGIKVAVDLDVGNPRAAEHQAGHFADAEVAPLVAAKTCHIAEGLFVFRVVLGQVPRTRAEGIEELHHDELVFDGLLAVDRPGSHPMLHLVDELLVHSSPRSAKLTTVSAMTM